MLCGILTALGFAFALTGKAQAPVAHKTAKVIG
jgi:hypothetical protein